MTNSPARNSQRHVLFLVMGGTGTGKSSFINLASDSNLEVSDSLRSITKEVALSEAFIVDDTSVTLVDTPGFDDTVRPDTQILASLASFLATSFENDTRVNGVIYLHSINIPRVGGASKRNITMFREMCGDNALKNSVIVTNMWSLVTDMATAERRENQLQTEETFFKPALDAGAQMARHDGTKESAVEIIRKLLGREPVPLRLQEELVNDRRQITETRACEILDEGISENRKKFERELGELKEELTEAISEGDEETREQIESLFKEAEEKLRALDRSREELSVEMQREKAKAEELVRTLKERERVALGPAGGETLLGTAQRWYSRLYQFLFGRWVRLARSAQS